MCDNQFTSVLWLLQLWKENCVTCGLVSFLCLLLHLRHAKRVCCYFVSFILNLYINILLFPFVLFYFFFF